MSTEFSRAKLFRRPLFLHSDSTQSINSTGRRSGLTLIEILVALTMTLVVLGAMAQAFSFASQQIASGRATLEMSSRLRNAQQLLRTDLAGVTVDIRPHTEITPQGYFEYIDGPLNDSSSTGVNGYLGDSDDVLAFTTRNVDGSFRGRFSGGVVQSAFAEVIWFTEETDLNNDGIVRGADLNVNFNDSITLYRRVLLIRPNLNGTTATVGLLDTGNELDPNNGNAGDPNNDPALAAAMEFFIENDISARWVDSDGDDLRDLIVANTLEDLARREFRFGRDSGINSYPHTFLRDGVSNTKMGVANFDATTSEFTSTFSGDDILLTDVAAFDLKVYSPTAVIDQVALDNTGLNVAFVGQSDIGYVGNLAANGTRSGDFVDLGGDVKASFDTRSSYDANGNDDIENSEIIAIRNGLQRFGFFDSIGDPVAQFSTRPTRKSLLAYVNPGSGIDIAYCTWSPHYETDGVNQDGDVNDNDEELVDEGTNGLDDDDANGVDDSGEQETAPPYPYPIRGMEITFRVIEKNTKQVRQSTVVHSFLTQ